MSQHNATLRKTFRSALANKTLADTLIDGLVDLQTQFNAAMDKLDVDGVGVIPGQTEIFDVTTIADTGALEKTTITCNADDGNLEVSRVTTVADTGAFESVVVHVPATAAATQADYFVLTDTTGKTVAFWLDIDAAGVAPTGAAFVAADAEFKIPIITGGTATQNATILQNEVPTVFHWNAVDNLDGTITYTQTLLGNCTDAARHNAADLGNGSFSFSGAINGAASNLNNTYFVFYSANDATKYVIWYNVSSFGVQPVVAGSPTYVSVAIPAGSADSAVAAATRAEFVLAPLNTDFTEDGATNIVRFTNLLMGTTTNVADGAAPTGFAVATLGQGAPSTLNSSFFTFFSATNVQKYVMWYNVNGEGVQPVVAGSPTYLAVAVAADAVANAVASASRAMFVANANFTETGATDQIIFECTHMGVTTDTADGAAPTGFSIVKTRDGAASNLNSTYFRLSSHTVNYYAWLNVNGEGVDPSGANAGRTAIAIPVAVGSSDLNVATAVNGVINPHAAFNSTVLGADVTITTAVAGSVTAPAAGTSGFTVVPSQVGTNATGGLDTNYAATVSLITAIINPDAKLTHSQHEATLRKTLRAELAHKRLADVTIDSIAGLENNFTSLLAKLDAEAATLDDADYVSVLGVTAVDYDAVGTSAQHKASLRKSLRSALAHRRLADLIADSIMDLQASFDAVLALLDAADINGNCVALKVTVIDPDLN